MKDTSANDTMSVCAEWPTQKTIKKIKNERNRPAHVANHVSLRWCCCCWPVMVLAEWVAVHNSKAIRFFEQNGKYYGCIHYGLHFTLPVYSLTHLFLLASLCSRAPSNSFSNTCVWRCEWWWACVYVCLFTFNAIRNIFSSSRLDRIDQIQSYSVEPLHFKSF